MKFDVTIQDAAKKMTRGELLTIKRTFGSSFSELDKTDVIFALYFVYANRQEPLDVKGLNELATDEVILAFQPTEQDAIFRG